MFAEWDPRRSRPASIGQVHRAITHDGRAVAVKVQYPGVDEAIRADLDNAGLLFSAMGMLFPGLEPGPLVEELRDRLVEELDYRLEAANQQLFADYYRGPPVHPRPGRGRRAVGDRVLTTELADGVRFDEMETWTQAERDLAAEAIFRFVFGSLYRLHAFNGDPHPGNYLFRPGGRVTFLDFGLVKRFTGDEITVLESMIQAMVLDHDIPRYRESSPGSGCSPGSAFTDDQIEDYFGHFYDFVLRDETATITSEYASETVRRFFDTGGPYGDDRRCRRRRHPRRRHSRDHPRADQGLRRRLHPGSGRLGRRRRHGPAHHVQERPRDRPHRRQVGGLQAPGFLPPAQLHMPAGEGRQGADARAL